MDGHDDLFVRHHGPRAPSGDGGLFKTLRFEGAEAGGDGARA
jgi:hypothetical protein